jgi:hypothetical protein
VKSSWSLVILLLIISAMLMIGCTTWSPAGVQRSEADPVPPVTLTPLPETGLQVRINTTGTWYGTVYTNGEILWKIEGSGPGTYDIPGNETGGKTRHRITVEATRSSCPYPSPLSIEVLESGEVAASVSTYKLEAPPSHILPYETLKLVYVI